MNDITIPTFTVGERVRGTGVGMSDKSEQGTVTRIQYANGRVWVDIIDDEGHLLAGFLAEELTTELEDYVQVTAGGYTRLTYIDPTGTLNVGDRVIVPMGYKNRDVIGVVKGKGRGPYTGPCKTVKAKLLVEELSA